MVREHAERFPLRNRDSMAQKNVDATASRKVELAIGELDALSVSPCVAVQYLSKMLQGQFSPASITDIAECEPVLAAELISLAQRLGSGPVSQRHAIRLILDRLDASEVRDILLSTKVTAGFEIEFASEHPAVPARKDLTLHSLAVACCARRIAEAAPSAGRARPGLLSGPSPRYRQAHPAGHHAAESGGYHQGG